MAVTAISDEEFAAMVEALGMGPAAQSLGIDDRGARRRRRRIESRTGVSIQSP